MKRIGALGRVAGTAARYAFPIRYAPLYSRWLARQPIFGAELGGLLLVMFGVLGADFGLGNLFWHERPWTQFLAGASVAALALLLWFLSFLRHPDPAALAADGAIALRMADPVAWRSPAAGSVPIPAGPAGWLRTWLAAIWLPMGVLLLARPMVESAVALAHARRPTVPGAWPLPLGAWLVAAAALLALGWAERRGASWRWRPWHGVAVVGAAVALVNALAAIGPARGAVTAVMALCVVLAELALAAFLTHDRPLLRIGLALGLLLAIGWTNGAPDKLRYPGLEPYYGAGSLVNLEHATAPQGLAPAVAATRAPGARPAPKAPAATPAASGPPPVVGEAEARGAKARRGRGADAIGAGRYREAIAEFDESARLDPRPGPLARARAGRCESRFRLGDLDGAIADGDEAIRLEPAFARPFGPLVAQIHAARGAVRVKSQAFGPALGDFDAAALLDPGRASYLRSRAGVRHLMGDFRGAIADDDAAIRLDPADAAAFGGRGEARLLTGDFAGALADLDAAIRLDPASRYHLARARAREDLGDLAGARADLDEEVRLRPDSAPSRFHRAQFLSRRQELPAAKTDLDAAIGMDLMNPEYLTARADTLDRQGNPDLAARDRARSARRIEWANAIAEAHAPAPPAPEGAVDDRGSLEAWREAVAGPGPGAPRPVMVVVATSGGGIAAAYWTARCLARVEAEVPDFPRRVRVVTGASGGMLGAALYVARLQPPPARRTAAELDAIADDLAKDSLTPAVRQMLLYDLPSILNPLPQRHDRGRALEDAWAENSRGDTDQPLSRLAGGERAGWRPSPILSPMMVEDGALLLISNLDLDRLGGNIELFRQFPRARLALTIGTAVRMNAAFPFVTPGVNLPTDPPRRVVDAGYLDNYGVGLACAWIERHRGWLLANTSGVVLVQIRAYPTVDRPGPAGAFDRVRAGLQFLTTPTEGVGTSRLRTMLDRNDERVRRLADWFNDDEAPPFFETVVFEGDDSAPLGWSLTAADRKRLDDALKSNRLEPEFAKLIGSLRRTPPPAR